MNDRLLDSIRAVIQEDVGGRGLRTDPAVNLITACRDDFQRACQSIAATAEASVAVVTGFFIPHAQPPCGETDGPLGALFLARALHSLDIRVALFSDDFCMSALSAGLEACGLKQKVPCWALPSDGPALLQQWQEFRRSFPLTHLVALERVGPSHTLASLQSQPEALEPYLREVPVEHYGRCHSMRGRDITEYTSPAHLLFENARGLTTIGIGDGGNEIGMGKVPWEVIRRNIPNGGLIACRTPTDHLLVSGISNWGAYGLAAGVSYLRGTISSSLWDPEPERNLLRIMVEQGPLVDGVSGRPAVMVDGLTFDRYAAALRRIGELFAKH